MTGPALRFTPDLAEAARSYLHHNDAGSASVWEALTGKHGTEARSLAVLLADTGLVYVSAETGPYERLRYETYDPATCRTHPYPGDVPEIVTTAAEAVYNAPDEATCAGANCERQIGAHLAEDFNGHERAYWDDFIVSVKGGVAAVAFCEDCITEGLR